MATAPLQKQLEWTLAACSRLLRPVVRLALSMGVKHAQLEEALRQELLYEGQKLLRERQGKPPNVSQLSVLTGLHRKDLTRRVQAAGEELPDTQSSVASRVFTRWLQHVLQDPGAWRIPITREDSGISFERLAAEETRRDVHFRSLLDEMVRLRVVSRDGAEVELNRSGFVPLGDLRAVLSYLADNGRDHLMASVANSLSDPPRYLERAIFTDKISLEECERLQIHMREKWDGMHADLYREMVLSEDKSVERTHRIRVGIYTYFEPSGATESPAAQEPPYRSDA